MSRSRCLKSFLLAIICGMIEVSNCPLRKKCPSYTENAVCFVILRCEHSKQVSHTVMYALRAVKNTNLVALCPHEPPRGETCHETVGFVRESLTHRKCRFYVAYTR